MNILSDFETLIEVVRPVEIDRDSYNCPVFGDPEREHVMALVMPTDTDAMGADRPDGVTSAIRTYFPKTYDKPLKGCSIAVRGIEYRVMGDPVSYPTCPTDYNRVVEAVRADG